MSLTRLSNQIEIAFWTAWVAVLRSPRTIKLLPGLPVAAAAVTLVLLAGMLFPLLSSSAAQKGVADSAAVESPRFPAFGSASSASQGAAAPQFVAQQSAATDRPSNGQRNLLVVLVDRLDASRPRLQGAWLLARAPALSQVAFLPLYPSSEAKNGAFNDSVEAGFRSDNSGVLPEAFTQALTDRGYWWDHFLVVDAAALAHLMEIAGSATTDDAALDAQLRLADNGRDPEAVLNDQMQIAQSLCDQSAQWRTQIISSAAVAQFTAAIRSDMAPDHLRLTLRSLTGTGGMVCQFPLMTGR